MSDAKHHGCSGRWGAQTWEVGDRVALTVQRAREAFVFALSLVPGLEAEAPPTQRAAEARTRGR